MAVTEDDGSMKSASTFCVAQHASPVLWQVQDAGGVAKKKSRARITRCRPLPESAALCGLTRESARFAFRYSHAYAMIVAGETRERTESWTQTWYARPRIATP